MNNFTSFEPNSLSTSNLQKILQTAVAPRPIAFASTVDVLGNVNLSPFSYFNVFSANPPILVFSPARRIRDNSIKHTLKNVQQTKEVVINIVNYNMVEQMSLASTEYDEGINEFTKSGLTQMSSVKVKPPRVGESPVAFECKVDDIIALGDEGGAGNLVICKVVYIHLNTHFLDADNQLDTHKLDLVARMGENWYTRCIKESIFEIPKPIVSKGIGVDSLPKHIYKTKVLSGNDLGRLGNFQKIPNTLEIDLYKKRTEMAEILNLKNEQLKLEKLHSLVKKQLKKNNLLDAIKTLFCL